MADTFLARGVTPACVKGLLPEHVAQRPEDFSLGRVPLRSVNRHRGGALSGDTAGPGPRVDGGERPAGVVRARGTAAVPLAWVRGALASWGGSSPICPKQRQHFAPDLRRHLLVATVLRAEAAAQALALVWGGAAWAAAGGRGLKYPP